MKSKPHTFRFNQDDFNFISKRENLKTAQQIFDFLIKEYMKLFRVDRPSIFLTNAPDVGYTEGESKEIYPTKEIRSINSKIKRSFENYQQLRMDCENEEDWVELKREISNCEHLTQKQKSLLTN